jgi:arylsulfatase A-like enzyme
LIVLQFLPAFALQGAAMTDRQKLNVLWICSDEFRPECLGAAGHPFVQTPNLDALAAEGVYFRNAFCQSSPCAPSRMSMHTGRYACSTGVVDNLTPLKNAEHNLAVHLQRFGLSPAIVGYNDYSVDPSLLPEGHPHKHSLSYEHFLPGYEVVLKHEYDSPEWYDWLKTQGYPEQHCTHETMYSPCIPETGAGAHLPCFYPARYKREHSEMAFVTNKSMEYIAGNADKQWFLSLNYIKPHGPYLCSAPFHSMYDPKEMPAPVRHPREAKNDHPYFSRCRADWAQTEFLDEGSWRDVRACYYGMISELDYNLGRLFDFLKESGQWEHTAIIFNSDHGTYLGDHYLAGKAHYFDAAVRVPLLIRDPAAEADSTRGTLNDVLIENVDIAPLICNFLGAPPSSGFQGKDPRYLLTDPNCRNHKSKIIFEFYYYNILKETANLNPEACRLWMLRDHKYKYVQFGEASMPPQLFDLQNDPGEFENLAQQDACSGIVADCCQRLMRWRMGCEQNTLEAWARQYR